MSTRLWLFKRDTWWYNKLSGTKIIPPPEIDILHIFKISFPLFFFLKDLYPLYLSLFNKYPNIKTATKRIIILESFYSTLLQGAYNKNKKNIKIGNNHFPFIFSSFFILTQANNISFNNFYGIFVLHSFLLFRWSFMGLLL